MGFNFVIGNAVEAKPFKAIFKLNFLKSHFKFWVFQQC